jgi:hypothetical protein
LGFLGKTLSQPDVSAGVSDGTAAEDPAALAAAGSPRGAAASAAHFRKLRLFIKVPLFF